MTCARVAMHLSEFLRQRSFSATDQDTVGVLIEAVREFTATGKRVRPLFCTAGWVAAGGDAGAEPICRVGAALEMFHSFALIHDDIMDASVSRRGQPTVHERFRRYTSGLPDEVADRFGTNAAILLGDLCLVWSDEMLADSGMTPRQFRAAQPFLQAMRSEVMFGQYLDVIPSARMDDLDRAWRVVRNKTASYTVAGPLQIGAALAGGGQPLLALCHDYGMLVGEAYQFRDDLLGVFGDPERTGKPADDDLRNGKRTVLMALAWQRADPAQRRRIGELHGRIDLDAGGAEDLRAVIRATRADTEVRRLIDDRAQQAAALARDLPIALPARELLVGLATASARRDR